MNVNSLLQGENISKRYGDKLLFQDLNINISEGDKIALVAKNGTGKTSLLKILAGIETADSGIITKRKDIRISFLSQDITLDLDKKIIDAIFSQDDEVTTIIKRYNEIIAGNDNKDELSKIIDKMDALNIWDYETRIKKTLGEFAIFDIEKKISELSGGQQKRVAIAAALINPPDILILDEPSNHLDLQMIESLEDFLYNTKSAVFMVTHDRYFLDRICNSIVELDGGKLYTYQGNYSYYVEKRIERINNLTSNIERSQNLLRREKEWMSRMPKARSHKAKYRIDEFENIKEKASQQIDNKKLELGIESSHLGNKVINFFNISKAYGENILIKDFSYKLNKYEKIGIIGNNGSGKTTFLDIITGRNKADEGRIEIGSTVKIAYYTQEGISFNEDSKPIDIIKNISENIKLKNGKVFSASGFLTYFLFPPEMQNNYIRKLSGGEKRRLYLCSILIQQPNVLILDEPTNDLDIVTLQVLEEFLSEIEASVIIVSHDRFFMDKIVEHILVFYGNGIIKEFPGNYTQFRNSKNYDDFNNFNSSSNPDKNINDKKELKEKNTPVVISLKNDNKSVKKKISFKEQYEFQNIEIELAKLESEKNTLEAELNSGSLQHDELLKKSKELAEILSTIEAKEERWLNLSELM